MKECKRVFRREVEEGAQLGTVRVAEAGAVDAGQSMLSLRWKVVRKEEPNVQGRFQRWKNGPDMSGRILPPKFHPMMTVPPRRV